MTGSPTRIQTESWEAYHREGGQGAAGRKLGKEQGAIRTALLGYMRAMGIPEPIPPADPSRLTSPARPTTVVAIKVDGKTVGVLDRPLSVSEDARARLLEAEGLSTEQIAERIGVTPDRVRDALGPPSFLSASEHVNHLPAADRPDQHPRIDGPPGAEPPVTTSSGDGAAVDVKPSAGHTSPEVTSEAGHRNGSVPTAEQFDDVASESADPLPMDAGSEYGRLLAERDQLIAGGVDPAELVVPLPPGRGHVAGPSPVAAADPEPPATHRAPGPSVRDWLDQVALARQEGHNRGWEAAMALQAERAAAEDPAPDPVDVGAIVADVLRRVDEERVKANDKGWTEAIESLQVPATAAYSHGYRVGWMAAALRLIVAVGKHDAWEVVVAREALAPPKAPRWPGDRPEPTT